MAPPYECTCLPPSLPPLTYISLASLVICFIRISPMLSSNSALLAMGGAFSRGRMRTVAMITPAKITKTICQLVKLNRNSAKGAPTICPAEPAAVTIPSEMDLFSSELARPTIARITPNPVPAKAMLRILGLPGGPTRAPMGPEPDFVEAEAKQVLADLGRR